MTRRRRRTLASIVAGTAALMLAAVGLNAMPAYADTVGEFLIDTSSTDINSSDPFIMPCSAGQCLYTSSDLSMVPPEGNPYPMNQTFVYTLSNGLNPSVTTNWQRHAAALTENNQYFNWVGTQPWQANHLWAPAAATGTDGNTYLYVPDVTSVGQHGVDYHTSSQIGVTRASNPVGPFNTYLGNLNVPGYASDPEVFPSTSTAGQRYLLWATGDNCTGLAIAPMTSMTTIDPGNIKSLSISGISALGDCDGTGPGTGPYMEGPSLFQFSQSAPDMPGLPGPYTLVFAAKPINTPPECATGNGQPGGQNEVIAYATSDTPMGDYTYQGVLMCGNSTEFTNQATITEMTTTTGKKRMVIIYHDGVAGNNSHNRKLEAECLWFGGGTFATVFRTPNGFQQCMAGNDAAEVALRDTRQGGTPTEPNGPVITNFAGSSSMAGTRWAVGPNEKYDLNYLSHGQGNTGTVQIKAQVNGKWVSAESAGTQPLIANRMKASTWETFNFQSTNDGSALYLVAQINSQQVEVRASDSKVIADTSSFNPIWLTLMHL